MGDWLIFFSHWLVVESDPLPHLQRKQLQQEAPNQFDGSDANADQVLVGAQRPSLDGSATVLDHHHLNDDCQNHNNDEVPVLEEVLEYVHLTFFNDSGINLIENLHHHENLEHKGKVKQLHGVCAQRT